MATRVLLTNDDGYNSIGLVALKDALARELGYEVTVVAPERQQSAKSHSITLHKPLRLIETSPRCFWLSGTPVDCIYVGLNHVFDAPPDLVVSGINDGYNLGTDVYYSGTVGAAAEAGLRGIPAMAVSMPAGCASSLDTAAKIATQVAKRIVEQGCDADVLNVNIPEAPKSIAWTRLGKRDYGDQIVENEDPRGRKYVWIGGSQLGYHSVDGSDCNAVYTGVASVTPMKLNFDDTKSLATPPFSLSDILSL